MKLIFKNNLNFIILISTLHLFYRLLIYIYILNENIFYYPDNFVEALSNKNFFEYFVFHHSIPIGNIILSKLILFFFGDVNLYFIFYALNSIYTLSLIIVLSKIYQFIFKKNTPIQFLILILISISLLSYDTWRVNHYDHFLIFLYSIFIYQLFNYFIKDKKINFNYKFTITTSLMAIFSNLFVIIYIILFFFIILFKKKYKINFKSFFYSSLIVLFFFSSVLMKNKISINEFTPTSIKGWNFIQRPLYTLGYEKYLDLYLNKLNLSKSNKLCASDIKKRMDSLDINQKFLSLVLHKCFFDYDKQIYDYVKLKKELKENDINNENLDEAIKLDLKDLKEKKWKFSGGHTDINLRTTVFFHKEAFKVYASSFALYPKEMFFGDVSTRKNQGVFFTFMNMFRWSGQLPYYYEPQHKDFNNNFMENFQKVFSIVILIGLLICFTSSFNLIKSFILKKEIMNYDLLNFLLLMICVGYNLTTSFITCCENQRNAVMIFPFLITLSSLSLFLFLKKIFKK